MGILTWILLGVIVLVAIGLGVGVFFTGLLRGAEIVGENPAVQNASEEAQDFIEDSADSIEEMRLSRLRQTGQSTSRGDAVLITIENRQR